LPSLTSPMYIESWYLNVVNMGLALSSAKLKRTVTYSSMNKNEVCSGVSHCLS
jgi:hypothetical protein